MLFNEKDKADAISDIKKIRSGAGIKRDFDERLRGRIAKDKWNDGEFALGYEYGYMAALVYLFNITYDEITRDAA